MRTGEIQGKLWGSYARDWADYGESTSNDLFKSVLEKTKTLVKGKNMLDIGCGAGGFCKMASEAGFNISGFDASEELISIARQRVPGAVFKTGDIEELPFHDNVYDAVTGFNSFQFAGNIVNALREAGRVTIKGGPVVVCFWGNPEKCDASAFFAALGPYMPAPQKSEGRKPLFTEGVMESYALEAGLQHESTEDIECIWKFKNEETALKAILSAGLISLAVKNAGEEKVKQLVAEAISKFREPSGSYRMRNTFRCVISRA